MADKILVVDDDLSLRQFLSIMIKRAGYECRTASRGEEALELMAADPADVVVTDLNMDGLDGMDVLRRVHADWPDTEVVMITAYATTENAVAAMKEGAFDYVVKPFNVDELKLILEKAFEKRHLARENETLRELLSDRFGYASLVGRSASMQKVYDLMERVKDTPITVLITGESGTGKELVARAIHFESDRRERPFQSINCGAMPEQLIESELFGYVKGAFTGAAKNHDGLFLSADKGTLFLDEIGEMPLPTQVKLLRAIQERKVKPVGGVHEQSVDVRIVAATNRDLDEEIREGRFREDLYYRLKVICIEMPSLRERLEDLPLLSEHLLQRHAEQLGREGVALSSAVQRAFADYLWPGNVRELENAIQRGLALCSGVEVQLEHLPDEIVGAVQSSQEGDLRVSVGPEGVEMEDLLATYERALLTSALDASGGVKKEAARLLGISFRSLRYRLQKMGMGLEPGDGDQSGLLDE
ncbi:MAG: Fis family transcriptional regulator [Rickettsiales bacterium]|nr:Fis family transcriptional regulator [Rickettsiales bacterium]